MGLLVGPSLVTRAPARAQVQVCMCIFKDHLHSGHQGVLVFATACMLILVSAPLVVVDVETSAAGIAPRHSHSRPHTSANSCANACESRTGYRVGDISHHIRVLEPEQHPGATVSHTKQHAADARCSACRSAHKCPPATQLRQACYTFWSSNE